jgi:hypothetical protein
MSLQRTFWNKFGDRYSEIGEKLGMMGSLIGSVCRGLEALHSYSTGYEGVAADFSFQIPV